MLAQPGDLSNFIVASTREQATWVYGLLRRLLDTPLASRTAQLSELAATIDAHPDRDQILDALRDFWSHHSYVRVIAEAGLPDEIFLVRELFVRALKHLMPEDEVQGDLYVLLDSVNLKEQDARWLASLPDSLIEWWAPVFRPSVGSVLTASKLLALRAASVALSRDLLTLGSDDDITRSSFFHLPALVERVVRQPADFHDWETQRDACLAELRHWNRQMEEEGTSASLIFRLRLLRSLVARIDQVLALRRPATDVRKFAVVVVHGFAAQRSLGSIINVSIRRLARSVVEKTGRHGTHYIAQNAKHWRQLGAGAILAGVITSFTALFKYAISSTISAPFLVALGHSLNYAASFLLMQAGGFLLASKMPAATAATLVDAMDDPGQDHMASVRAISQTQTIVTIGNLLGAVPASIAVDRVCYALSGHPFLTSAEAAHGVHMLFPLQSLTIPFAIVTGVFLWLSSLATGWTANYIAVSKMEPAICHSLRIRYKIGSRRAVWLSHWVKHHAPGSVGYITLGFLLGAVPILVALFGIPLEVRHVTLAAASLGYAFDNLWLSGALTRHDVILSASGILLVGFLNIFTSFALSFLLALRAREVRESKARRFLREVGQEFLTNPVSFLVPQQDAQ